MLKRLSAGRFEVWTLTCQSHLLNVYQLDKSLNEQKKKRTEPTNNKKSQLFRIMKKYTKKRDNKQTNK